MAFRITVAPPLSAGFITIRLSKIFSICLGLLGIVFFDPFLLIVHFRSNVQLLQVAFRCGSNLSICILSWRVGVRLKNSATGVDFYLLSVVGSSLILVGSIDNPMICLLFVVGSSLILVGSVDKPMICPDEVVPCFSLGCVPQVVYFFPWIQTDWGSISDGCVSLRFRHTFQCPD